MTSRTRNGLYVRQGLTKPGDAEFERWRRKHPRIAGGAGTVVQHTALTTQSTTQNSTLAFPSNITSGNLLLVGVTSSCQNIPNITVTDNAAGGSNTYTEIKTASDTSTICRASLFSAPITHGAGTAPTVTVTLDQTTSIFGTLFTIMEVSGVNNTVDVSVSKSNATGAVSTGATGTTAGANEFAVAIYADGASGPTAISAGTGWTDEGSHVTPGIDGSVEIQDTGAAGSAITGTWTVTGTPAGYCALAYVFTTAPPPPPKQSTLNMPMRARRV